MKNLTGNEKQIAWADEIREQLIKAVVTVERLNGKSTKITNFIKWFCDECEDASAIILFKDVKLLSGAPASDYTRWMVKMASKPEMKQYADKFFA